MTDSEVDSDKVYVCSFAGCKFRFRQKNRLRNHLNAHQGIRPYKCQHEGCDKGYTSAAGLKRHTQKIHEPKEKYDRLYRCLEEGCDKVFKSSFSLNTHLKNVHEGRKYKCSYCPQAFKKSRGLKIHEYQHTGIKPFKCPHGSCGKGFLLPSKLKAHLKCHAGYACTKPGCDLKFEKWTDVRRHIHLDHRPELKCKTCGREFKTKTNLRTHEETHEQTRKILACPYEGCRRFYYFESNLRHHIASAHEGKTHRCTEEGCGKEFKHKVSLMKHMKFHGSAIPVPAKKPRTCRKRRSMAAYISGHKPPLKEDLKVILKRDGDPASSDTETNSQEDGKLPEVKVTSDRFVPSLGLGTPSEEEEEDEEDQEGEGEEDPEGEEEEDPEVEEDEDQEGEEEEEDEDEEDLFGVKESSECSDTEIPIADMVAVEYGSEPSLDCCSTKSD